MIKINPLFCAPKTSVKLSNVSNPQKISFKGDKDEYLANLDAKEEEARRHFEEDIHPRSELELQNLDREAANVSQLYNLGAQRDFRKFSPDGEHSVQIEQKRKGF